jgi:hypothetical protein
MSVVCAGAGQNCWLLWSDARRLSRYRLAGDWHPYYGSPDVGSYIHRAAIEASAGSDKSQRFVFVRTDHRVPARAADPPLIKAADQGRRGVPCAGRDSVADAVAGRRPSTRPAGRGTATLRSLIGCPYCLTAPPQPAAFGQRTSARGRHPSAPNLMPCPSLMSRPIARRPAAVSRNSSRLLFCSGIASGPFTRRGCAGCAT